MASITARGKKQKIYIRFRWQTKEMYEPTVYCCERDGAKGCKCRNCRLALGIAAEIERKIEDGTFFLEDYFPKSKALKLLKSQNISDDILFSDYARNWLEFVNPPVYALSFCKKVKEHFVVFINLLGHMKLKDIRSSHVKNVASCFYDKKNKPKTVKNKISNLSLLFEAAIQDRLVLSNPCRDIRYPKIISKKPDPFELSEVLDILDKMKLLYPDMVLYFATGFFSGIRSGEILALEWEDIDMKDLLINVSKTRTVGQLKEGTKTGKSIKVDIIDYLVPYILEHRNHCYSLEGSLFRTAKGDPIKSYNSIVRRWKHVLNQLGIRYRQPYQTRHTFAVLMIRAGEELNWIKNQLGHATLEMLLKIYGNWYFPKQKGGQKFQQMLLKESGERLNADL